MKKVIYLLSIYFLFTSCDLEEKPYSISIDNLKDSPDGAKQIVTSIYDVFWSSYMMKKTYMEWIDMDHDHAAAEAWVVSGAGMGNITTHWAYNSSSDMFMGFYRIVSRANFALENLPNFNSIPQETNDQLKGEALFLRAFAYFHLVRMYGGVPLRLSTLSEKDIPRASVYDVYNQITLDLKEADSLMSSWTEGASSNEWGHVNKTAIKLLLAKVYATMGSNKLASEAISITVNIKTVDTNFTTDPVAGSEQFDANFCYAEVKKLCDEVIAHEGGPFRLMPNYLSIWGSPNTRNNEFVWGVPGGNEFKTEHLGYYYTPQGLGGQAWAGMAYNLWERYENTDERKIHGVFHYMKETLTKPNFLRFPNDAVKYGTGPDGVATTVSNYSDLVFTTKWYDGDIANPSLNLNPPSYHPQDVVLIRFCDAYLLRAEALNELDQPAEALADLDIIRQRAKASLKTGTTTDKAKIRSLIFEERAFEYAAEFNRKFDLLRMGLYLKVMNATGTVKEKYGRTITKVREPRSVLYAVPTVEVTQNKLFGPNNPGW